MSIEQVGGDDVGKLSYFQLLDESGKAVKLTADTSAESRNDIVQSDT